MRKINSVKTVVDEYEFDSLTEAEFYKHLKGRTDIEEIIVHPTLILMDEFSIFCGRCKDGFITSPKTGRKNQCKRCKGTGVVLRRPWHYTPDFKVTWKDGSHSYYDVKGGFKNERFNLVKKMFEHKFHQELLAVKPVKNEWKYM